MTTPTTLADRLRDLAEDAPSHLDGAPLWDAGRRHDRQRRVRALAAVAAVVVAVLGVGATVAWPGRDASPEPAAAAFSDLHLPRMIHAPDGWTEGTDEAGPPGVLAAVSMSTRIERDGLLGSRRSSSVFGVSAVDGSTRFLDLRGASADMLGNGTVVLSPDGTKVGYVRYRGEEVVGWAVYDTVTGSTRFLDDPEQAVIRGTDAFEIIFSGDSRYLLTNYSPSGSDRAKDDELVVWDVETGEATSAESQGHYWLPSPGSGPSGVVWSRGQRVLRFDPESGESSSERLPHDVVHASYGPSGELAYVAWGERSRDPWRLVAGGRDVDVGFEPRTVIGWRDAGHVVVGNLRGRVAVVDVETGEARADRLRTDTQTMTPVYATDLWANDLVPGTRPPPADDPRRTTVVAGVASATVLVLAGASILWRRRRVPPA
ncbi:hypothetical protein [Nocardioides sp. 1609]|uniref:hypothetical protein n=1 Tax=Nocardioides sp. 1609 TaxID=2508327 RepID=UPI0010704B43|nr:hypothetical protein [Nocardioides sp. 1609]